MKILLIKDVKSLGKAGDVKEVKDGYGQNYLIAKGFARRADKEVLKQWEEGLVVRALNEAKEIKLSNDNKEKLESMKFTIKHKVGANGHLIGTVTTQDISKELKNNGIILDKKQISLDDKIKTVGVYSADCKLGSGIHAKIILDIIEEI